ncbi:MAG: hypothetical protein QM765_40225 [Myxococcales bacterium]
MPDPKTTATPELSKEEARKALDVERDAILKDIGDDEAEHHRAGVHYSNIVDRNLAVLAGYKTATEFGNAELQPLSKSISKSTLQLYARVAGAFDEATTTRWGTTKLDKLLTLRDVLNLDALPLDLADLEIHTTDKAGTPKTSKFAQCSLAELSAAIKLAKAPIKASTKGLDQDAVQAAESLQAVVDLKLGEDGPFAINVEQRRGQHYFHVRFIPVERLELVLKAMLGKP